MSDYYNTLGVSKDATPDEIKRAYRRLASQHHPDKGGDTKKFQEVEEAYRTLSDPEKRSEYDNPRPQMDGFSFNRGGVPPGFEDIFAHFNMGGNPFGFSFRTNAQPQRNKTLNMQTSITLEDAYNGKDLIANVTLPNGQDHTIEIKIPAGIQDGTTLRLSGVGDNTYPELPRGDIHLNVQVQPHHLFERKVDDLVVKIRISCIDAILGKNITVNTIDGRVLEVVVRPGTQPGQMLAAQGYGMPNMTDNRFRGRLLMELDIFVPTDLSDAQKDILKKTFN